MGEATQNGVHETDETIEASNVTSTNTAPVPKVDKRVLVLRFLSDHDLPFKPKQLYGALLYQREITFAYRTLQNIVKELADEGHLQRVEVDHSAGEVRPLPPDADGRMGYYVITDAGRERAAE